jgi:hypothetical protein
MTQMEFYETYTTTIELKPLLGPIELVFKKRHATLRINQWYWSLRKSHRFPRKTRKQLWRNSLDEAANMFGAALREVAAKLTKEIDEKIVPG